jgi:hypothetical protein
MEQEGSHICRILIVIEHRVHVNGVFPTVLERICEGFVTQFDIDEYLTNAVGCGRPEPETAIRKGVRTTNTTKSLDGMVDLLHVLGCGVDIVVKDRARHVRPAASAAPRHCRGGLQSG